MLFLFLFTFFAGPPESCFVPTEGWKGMTRSCSLKLFVFALLIGFSCLPATGQNIPAERRARPGDYRLNRVSGRRQAEVQRLRRWAADLNSHLDTSSAGGPQFGPRRRPSSKGFHAVSR